MHEPWLLVFDNADDKEIFRQNPLPSGNERTSPLHSYLPRAQNGSTLITTRDKRVAGLSSEDDLIEILPMTESEAKELLAKRLRRKNRGLNDLNSDELCKVLEYLPLAITQAAAFISEKDSTVDEYLELFHKSDTEMQILLSEDSLDKRRDQDSKIPNSVIRAWKVTFDQIREQDVRASEILSLMAVLDGQGISKMLLKQNAENETEFMKAVGTLKAFSLISKEPGTATFMIHNLVQVSTRKWLDIHREIAHWQERALEAVTNSFPSDSNNIKQWTTCEALLPHVNVVLQRTYKKPNKWLLREKAEILHKVSSYSCQQGRWDDAYQQAKKAYDIRDEILGPEDPLTLTSMYSVARYLVARSKFEAAENIFQQHFNLTETILGPEHRETLKSMAFLAYLKFFYKGQFSEGEESYRKALELRKRALGLEHPDTLTSMANLGQMLRRQGKHVAAVEIHREVLAHRERVLRPEHPDTSVSRDYLSQALSTIGKHKEAEEMCQQALQKLDSKLGPKHPKTFGIMGSLAYVLQSQMRYEESEKMYRQVLAIRKEVLGEDHRDTIMNSILLADVLESQGLFEEAEELYRESLPASQKQMGPEHPDTINCLRRLATVLRELGKPDAEAVTWELLELQEKTLSVPHETMLTIHCLASRLEDRQDYSGAEKMFRKLMELRKQVFGPESDEMVRVMRQLMFNLGSQGKPEEALEMCQSLEALQIKMLGVEHPETIKTVNNMVSYLQILGRQEESECVRQKSLELQEKVLDDDHPNSITKLNRSARSLESEGKYQEAIVTYQQALSLQFLALGWNHPQTVSTTLDIQGILGYTGSEPDLPPNQNSRTIWLTKSERLVEFTSRYPTRCNPHSKLFRIYQRTSNSGRVRSRN